MKHFTLSIIVWNFNFDMIRWRRDEFVKKWEVGLLVAFSLGMETFFPPWERAISQWRKIENVFRIKQRIKIRFSFLGSLRINTWISDSIVTSKCGIWKLETRISITAKQATSSKASSKSTRTVLPQNSVLAKESEVSES